MDREADGEDGPLSFPQAFGFDCSAVELYKVVNDGEAETEAAVSPRRCAVALNERFEDMRKKLLIYSLAAIADAELNFGVIMLQRNLDAAVLRGKLDRVANQVRENLVETFTITQNFRSGLQVTLQLQGSEVFQA